MSRTITIYTPEMVRLELELADPSLRLWAFLIDLLVMHACLAILCAMILLAVAKLPGLGTVAFAAILLISFIIRSFYFIVLELSWRGQTPGKKLYRLRVIAVDGGAVAPSMVMARNLTREVEVFLPLIALLLPDVLVPGASVPVRLAAITWTMGIAFLPLLNTRRARLGDLVAGTAVVTLPRALLLDDLLAEAEPLVGEPGREVPAGHKPSTGSARHAPSDLPAPREPRSDPGKPAPYTFTRQQLDVYGIYELQVLEDVLRRHDSSPDPDLLYDVCARIMRKIRWPGTASSVPADQFLRAFYAAQRDRLEQQMLLGRRRERKRR